jgi:hypothetical protein
MTILFPESWATLAHPTIRSELILSLEEIIDEKQTAKWLTPDPDGPALGIDEVFHFFFDDHDFDGGDIGFSLFDDEEVAAITRVKVALNAIHGTNRDGDSHYFLRHDLWPDVTRHAGLAYRLLAQKGLPALELGADA